MEKINEIKLPEGVDRIAVKQYDDKIVIEFIPVEDIPQPKFKIGDKVRFKKGGYIGTNKYDELPLTVSGYHNKRQNILDCKGFPFLFHEDWFEPYVEELKKGDLAIFWGDNNLNPTIRLYHVKSYNGHSDNFGTIWDNVVKWDGTKEQFEKVLRDEIG